MSIKLLQRLGFPSDKTFVEWPKSDYELLDFGMTHNFEPGYISLDRLCSKGSISFSPAFSKRVPPKNISCVMIFDCKSYKAALITKYQGIDAVLVESTARSWLVPAKQVAHVLNEMKMTLTEEMIALVNPSLLHGHIHR